MSIDYFLRAKVADEKSDVHPPDNNESNAEQSGPDTSNGATRKHKRARMEVNPSSLAFKDRKALLLTAFIKKLSNDKHPKSKVQSAKVA